MVTEEVLTTDMHSSAPLQVWKMCVMGIVLLWLHIENVWEILIGCKYYVSYLNKDIAIF